MNDSKTTYVALWALTYKEINRIFRIWTQTLLPPVITQSLYFVIFGGLIGSQVTGYNQYGGYMAFLVPGIVMMAIITASYSNVVSSFFGAKFMRNYEEILVSPTPSWVILVGYCLGGIIRGILVGLLVFLTSLLMVKVRFDNLFLIFIFAILTSTAFSLGGFLNSLFARKFDDVQIIPTFVLTPLTYLGGVFYSLDSLPSFWQNISRLNPIVYMIDGFRYGFFGVSSYPLLLNIGLLAIFNIIFFSINLRLINKGYGLRT
jgi:ABC-2 type transport system permease protein